MERGRIQGLSKFWRVPPIISVMGKATKYELQILYAHVMGSIGSKQKPIKNFGKSSRGRSQRLSKIFRAPIGRIARSSFRYDVISILHVTMLHCWTKFSNLSIR